MGLTVAGRCTTPFGNSSRRSVRNFVGEMRREPCSIHYSNRCSLAEVLVNSPSQSATPLGLVRLTGTNAVSTRPVGSSPVIMKRHGVVALDLRWQLYGDKATDLGTLIGRLGRFRWSLVFAPPHKAILVKCKAPSLNHRPSSKQLGTLPRPI